MSMVPSLFFPTETEKNIEMEELVDEFVTFYVAGNNSGHNYNYKQCTMTPNYI